MTGDRSGVALDLFNRAVELAEPEREALLTTACAGDPELLTIVRAMLAADSAASPLLDAEPGALRTISGLDPIPLVGRRIGPYTILEVLGQGGMGVVCLAERADVQKRVALKLVRGALGAPDWVRRFGRERRVLAQLDHPTIARLVDAGTAEDGTPWFAMDYVEGRPLDRWVTDSAPPLRVRLELFHEICGAVAYAHAQLVVHRDLKPANVLVDSRGQPRLLDFGIAKLLDDTAEAEPVATRTGLRLMTPRYASPEQAAGLPISTASDIYQLGVMLGELLTGRAPEGGSPPAGRRGELASDLETIIAKATEADPARRYPTVEALAADIRRFLDGHPILARRATIRYRLAKFVARHRVASGVGLAAALGLVGFVVTLQVQSRRIALERTRAQQVASFLGDLLAGADPEVAQGDTLTVAALLDRSATRIAEQAGENPLVQGQIALVVADAYWNLDRRDEAIALQTTAVHTLGRIVGRRDSVWLRAAAKLGSYHGLGGDPASARLLADTALAAARALPRARRAELAFVLQKSGLVRQLAGDVASARELVEEALAIYRSLPHSTGKDMESALVDLAYADKASGSMTSAEAYFREALQSRTRRLGTDHSLTAKSAIDLATLLAQRGSLEEADSLVERAIAGLKRVYPGPTSHYGHALSAQAAVRAAQGRLAEAEAIEREALAIRSATGGADSTGFHNSGLASYIQRQGRLEEAADLHRKALDFFRRTDGVRHLRGAIVASNLAYNLYLQRKLPQADSLYRYAIPILDSAWTGTSRVTSVLYDHAFLMAIAGRCADAEPALRRVLDLVAADSTVIGGGATRPQRTLGWCLLQAGRLAEAEPVLLTAHERLLAQFGEAHDYTRASATDLARLYQEWNKPEQAARYAPAAAR